jgi:hypothetical protein
MLRSVDISKILITRPDIGLKLRINITTRLNIADYLYLDPFLGSVGRFRASRENAYGS